jgi:hypothetical protein
MAIKKTFLRKMMVVVSSENLRKKILIKIISYYFKNFTKTFLGKFYVYTPCADHSMYPCNYARTSQLTLLLPKALNWTLFKIIGSVH